MTETTTIEISIATKGKLHSIKTQLEEIMKKTISYDKVLKVILSTKPVALVLEEMILES